MLHRYKHTMRYYEWVYIVHANRPTSSFPPLLRASFSAFFFPDPPFKLVANQEKPQKENKMTLLISNH